MAQATSPGASLSIGKAAPSTTPVKLTAQPARPASSRAHVTRKPQAHRTPRARHRATGLSGRVTAHVAGDPGVTIADFHFSPASTTIHVGDTITWSNSGPSSHTATAGNGSFNTGILKKGQSASHTFTQPGTYAYACQIHPFMHGTIIVLASTTSTTTSAGGDHAHHDDACGHDRGGSGPVRPDAAQHRLQRPRRTVGRACVDGPGGGPAPDPSPLTAAASRRAPADRRRAPPRPS